MPQPKRVRKREKAERPPMPEPHYFEEHGLRKVRPYTFVFETFAKERWLDRTVLDIFKGDFKDRSPAYYEHAIRNGTITINGEVVSPDYKVTHGDVLRNMVHRHEPPVVGGPIGIVHRDDERGLLVVEKPGSMPVHATGRYNHNSLLSILKYDYGLPRVGTANRLDRLTSGIMVCATTQEMARVNAEVFSTPGAVQKEYVCRAVGHFPDGDVTCEQPLLTVDRQLGVNIVHEAGKHAKTVFKRISYHAATDTSVIHCRPITGRSHQIRVHLQYLGHPIANDPIYRRPIWGPSGGKDGLYQDLDIPANGEADFEAFQQSVKALDLTSGDDLGLSTSTLLSPLLRQGLTFLRRERDIKTSIVHDAPNLHALAAGDLSAFDDTDDYRVEDEATGPYCRACGQPLLPDPRPEQLYIWLHAMRYSSSAWDFASPSLPEWAKDSWDGEVVQAVLDAE